MHESTPDAADAAASESSSKRRPPTPALAALFSFLWPGLGQAYRGRRRRALIYALPTAVVTIGLVVAFLALGPLVMAVYLFSPQVSLAALALVIVAGIWRSVSIVDAGRPGDRVSAGLTVVLLAIVVLSHAWLAASAIAFYQAGQAIYEPVAAAPTPTPGVVVTPDPGATGPFPTPTVVASTPTPTATPVPLPGQSDRVTVLFVGVDNTHGERLALSDTMMVVSYDPVGRTVTMISVPRDTAKVPYYGGGEFTPRVNTLMQAATRNPEDYPDGPMGSLINEMSYLVGIPINYYARIDISGFTQLIDLVGGVDVVVGREIDDPTYQFLPDEIGFHLDAGPQHLDGKLATAYARSRHGAGGSDYQRAQRQQQILLALRERLNDPAILANLPSLLFAVSQIVRTDAPLDRLNDVVGIANASGSAETQRFVLGPPRYAHRGVAPDGGPTQTTMLDMEEVAALSIQLFGDLSRYAH